MPTLYPKYKKIKERSGFKPSVGDVVSYSAGMTMEMNRDYIKFGAELQHTVNEDDDPDTIYDEVVEYVHEKIQDQINTYIKTNVGSK